MRMCLGVNVLGKTRVGFVLQKRGKKQGKKYQNTAPGGWFYAQTKPNRGTEGRRQPGSEWVSGDRQPAPTPGPSNGGEQFHIGWILRIVGSTSEHRALQSGSRLFRRARFGLSRREGKVKLHEYLQSSGFSARTHYNSRRPRRRCVSGVPTSRIVSQFILST